MENLIWFAIGCICGGMTVWICNEVANEAKKIIPSTKNTPKKSRRK